MEEIVYIWILGSLLALLLVCILLGKFGRILQQRIFATFWSRLSIRYHDIVKETKAEHYGSMQCQDSANPTGQLRILEIGAGSGGNFEFFPPNSRLSVVEPNTFFKPTFYERQRKYPWLIMDKFIVGKADDMKDVEDGSVDIVVSTCVLCSVDSVERTLKEIQRVLVPGGKYYFWEHVHDTPGTLLHRMQWLLNPLWNFFTGCYINRNIDLIIKNDNGFSMIDQERFNIPSSLQGHYKMVRIHLKGVATNK